MKKIMRFLIFFILVAFLLFFLLGKGIIDISFVETWKIIKGIITNDVENYILTDVIYYLRLPRFFLSVMVGCGLAVIGCVMQAVMRNPLADSYLLGISSGAGLGAIIAIICGFSNIFGFDAVGLFAFLGAMVITLFIVAISSFVGKVSISTLLLAGLALNSVCAALISLLISMFADVEHIQSVTYWLMGSLQNATWNNVFLLTIIVIISTLFFMFNSRILNLMLLGDEISVTLGYKLSRARNIYILICALVIGIIVYNSGIIGFVGLVIPHIVRLFIGSNYKILLPMSALTGAICVVAADLFSRIAIIGSEIPIGIVVAVIGAPVFVCLLINKNYGYMK